ncbi:catalase [uncultured Cyclobacterium sp.]|uniref:catalase n=1 Tax=uncultured Cyclobacterium sp. TaxID=453820 RepID=UPI0030EB4144|tara:strand:- start:20 stop:979 length:960 start_codon:yes stop_codon:yes gene_type:complete
MTKEHNPKEEKEIQDLIQTMKDYLDKEYADGKILRNFHPKMHGLLNATLTIHNNLPEELRQGLFKNPGIYQTWIRLSNAPPKVKSDKPASGRGLAIKVLDVPGELLESDPIGSPTQNLLLTTSPILSAWNVSLYKKAIKAVLFGLWEQVKFAVNPSHWRSIFLTFKYSKKHENLLSLTYFSGGAFEYGPELFVKFVLTPNEPNLGYTLNQAKGDNFLKSQLIKDCEAKAHAFTLNIQLHKNDELQPLENTSIAWEGELIPVATLDIPQQSFDNAERIKMGEALEFSPWIGLKEHTPVGGINRARRRVYKELAAYRKSKV